MKDDRMVSDINEYEILQLLAGEARTLLGRYAGKLGHGDNPPALHSSLHSPLHSPVVVKCPCWMKFVLLALHLVGREWTELSGLGHNSGM